MVDKALESQRQYVEANRSQIELDLENDRVRMELANEAELEQLRSTTKSWRWSIRTTT